MTRHRTEWREQPRRCQACGDLADHQRTIAHPSGQAVVRWYCSECDPDDEAA